MLVLARRKGEEVQIGDAIRIVVVSVKGSQVRLGFDAPPEVAIRRGEICFDASSTAEFAYDLDWPIELDSSVATVGRD